MTRDELKQSLFNGGVELSDRKLDEFFYRLSYVRFLMTKKGLFAQHPDPAKREYVRPKKAGGPLLYQESWV